MQIKTKMGHHLPPVKIIIIIEKPKADVDKNVEKLEPLCTVGGNVNWYSHLKNCMEKFLKKLKMELPYDPTVLLLEIYPKLKPESQGSIRHPPPTPFIAALTVHNS